MSGLPGFKVYRRGHYVASCKYPKDAAAIIAASGTGQIKWHHGVTLWKEGSEDQEAAESYDHVAAVCERRLKEKRRTQWVRQ